MTKKPLVGIIILHFGKLEVTKDCLDSLIKIDDKAFNYKVIVIDNSLNKNIQQIIKRHAAVDKILIPEKNLGFAGGNNLGIKQCIEWNCDYILFLNNDTVVESHFLKALIKVISNSNFDIAGPVIEHQFRKKTYYDHGGVINWKKGQPGHINKTTYSTNQNLIQRDFVSGCCMLVSRKLINKIGGFNESYFLYLEDVELCLRAQKQGFKVALVPSSKIFHKGSQSSTELTKILYSWRNSLKLSLNYVPNQFKLTAILFNLVFYPALYLRWQLGHFKRKLI